MSMVLRGVTTISISASSSSALSKTTDTSKGKVSTSKSPITHFSHLRVIKQSEIKSFHKTLQTLSPNQDEYLLRKSMIQNGSYTPIGVIERRLIRS